MDLSTRDEAEICDTLFGDACERVEKTREHLERAIEDAVPDNPAFDKIVATLEEAASPPSFCDIRYDLERKGFTIVRIAS